MTDQPVRWIDGPAAALVSFHIFRRGAKPVADYYVVWWPDGDPNRQAQYLGMGLSDELPHVMPEGLEDLASVGFGPIDVGNGYIVRVLLRGGGVVAEMTTPGGAVHEIPPQIHRDRWGELVESLRLTSRE